MQNCVGEVLLLGIFAVAAYRDWKEQMICVYVPLAAGIAGLVLHLILPTQKLTDLLLGAGPARYCAASAADNPKSTSGQCPASEKYHTAYQCQW